VVVEETIEEPNTHGPDDKANAPAKLDTITETRNKPPPSPQVSSESEIAEPGATEDAATLADLEAFAKKELPLRELICNISLQALGGVLLDMALTATPCKYRMIDCGELVENQRLRIYEYTDLPTVPFSAISYVWRGLSAQSSRAKFEYGLFNVCGAEDGDPINIELLVEVAKLSLREGSGLVWLDRLCVLQTSREDKAWQIMRMHGVYQSCSICLVIPGGLSRLADLCEQTAWIERAWTLQEAMVPPRTLVLFAWKFGSGSLQDNEDVPQNIFELTRRKSAVAELSKLLEICTEESFLTFYGSGNIWRRVWPALFDPGPARTLQMAMTKQTSEWTQSAIWRCAHMRVSSRPVDMIFSIMGVFGVSLDPKAFHPDDRLHATVALMQAILRNGGKASWMGALSGTNPCKQLSSFMEIRPPGDRYLQDTSVDFDVLPVDLKGTMDDDGYFQFSAKAVPVVSNRTLHWKEFRQANQVPTKDPEGRFFFFMGSSAWSIPLETQQEHEMIMILLGRRLRTFDDPPRYITMIIEKHAPGLYHRTYNRLGNLGEGWREIIDGWEEQTFKLGGREELGPHMALEQRKKGVKPSGGPASGNTMRRAMLLGAEPTGTDGIGEKLPILVEEQKGRPDGWEELFSSVWYNYLDTVSDPWNIDSSQLLPDLQIAWNLCFSYTKETISLDSDIHSLAIQKISEWRRGFALAALDVLDASLEEERKYSEMDLEDEDGLGPSLPHDDAEYVGHTLGGEYSELSALGDLFASLGKERKYLEIEDEDGLEQSKPHDDAEYVRQTLGGDNPETQPFLWGVYSDDKETGALVEHALSFWDPNDRKEDKLKKVDMHFNEARWAAKTHSHLEAIARLSENEWDEISSSVNRKLSSKRLAAELESLRARNGRSI
ncbi:hypothetical protein H0H81_010481, partial [Sphagnurus paluster]